MKDGHRPSDCLKHHYNELPEECQSLRKATFECKRGMVSVSELSTYSYISLSEHDSWICESDLEGTSWGPSSSTRQRPRRRHQNHRHYKYVEDDYEDDTSHLFAYGVTLLKVYLSYLYPTTIHPAHDVCPHETLPHLYRTHPKWFPGLRPSGGAEGHQPSNRLRVRAYTQPLFLRLTSNNSVHKIAISTNEQKVRISREYPEKCIPIGIIRNHGSLN
jgi:hypothetical protein